MDYQQTEDYLFALPRLGIHHGQKNIQALLDKWDNPEQELHCVQVAGTNGKGSVTTLLSSILQTNGFRVGKYVSPHLDRLTERIQINGKDIPCEELARLVSEVKALGHDCTFFEVMTAVALKYFVGKTDYCVLEVGLGGRLDATSVVIPEVAVITNVDFDHMHVLGDSLEKIAFEKAGVIKPGMTVITAEKKPEALSVIRREAKERGARLREVEKGMYKLAMLGVFQQWNAACAVEAAKELGVKEPLKGLDAIISGRAELQGNVLMDVAHNPAGMCALREVLDSMEYERLFVVLGVKNDKDAHEMLKFLPKVEELFVTEYEIAPNPMDCGELVGQVKSVMATRISVIRRVREALDYAKKLASEKDLVLVTGSTFTVSEARGSERQLDS
ncbi:bifunctional folylpolyglutamate synthase/dihydrofolate synthase [archaeon]|nr:bifunctional folylpolyglutamate synthase/dihydrofolate synthase [archaeon]